MFRKNYFTFLLTISLFLVSGVVAFAQNSPVNGRVELKKADGTTEPVVGALIEVFRIDIKAKLPSGKTDKKGNFSFAGLPLGAKLAFSISAPNISPEIFPNVKPGTQNMVITVSEGNGKQWTEDEVRQALATPTSTGTTTEKSNAELTAEQKKQKAEYDKQVAEIAAKNEKVKNSTAIIQKSLEEGQKAFDAKNYDLAIIKFDEGYNADPDFAGTAPVLLNNKALALKSRGFDFYKKAVTDSANKASLMEMVKKDFTDSINASQKALDILKTATTTDANLQKSYDGNKVAALSNMVETYRLILETKADESKIQEAVATLEAYLPTQTDVAIKTKVSLNVADAIRKTGNSDAAIPLYRKILEISPDQPEALAGLGLSLFNSGAVADANGQKQEGKAQMQEGLDLMQRFVDVSPAKPDDTQQMKELKASVKEAVDYLKTQNLAPQKTKTTSTKKKT